MRTPHGLSRLLQDKIFSLVEI
jgi:hypothetical protein